MYTNIFYACSIEILVVFTDVNECLEGEDNCDANAECNNTEGGYECTCREGFSGNGTDCEGKPP